MSARAGRYEILGNIASGGMATVHLGKAVGVAGFERLVAIKIMHAQHVEDAEYVTMFLDEARLAARIRHPNVVATLDVQQDEDVFIVMDYVEGPSLSAILRKVRQQLEPMPVSITLRVMCDALAGLHAAHELTDGDGRPFHIVHRDVSPQNILVGIDGVTRITDFGVAKAAIRMASTKSGKLKGKIGYMSPEQVRGTRVDRRSDVFAAGVVLWETLTGRRLFKADNEATVLLSLLEGAKQSPRQVNVDVPPELDKVCMRALEVDRTRRYATAGELEEALERAADEDGMPIASTRAVSEWVKALGAHHPVELSPDPKSLRLGAAGEEISGSHGSEMSRVAAVLSRRPEPPSRSRWPLVVVVASLSIAAAGGYRAYATAPVSVAVSNMIPVVRLEVPAAAAGQNAPSPLEATRAAPSPSASVGTEPPPMAKPPAGTRGNPGRGKPKPRAPKTFETKEL